MALSCRPKDWATAASEPRCRCVYMHHGLDPPPRPGARGSAEYKDVAAMIPNGHRPIEAGSASCRAMFLLCPYAPPLTEPQGPPVRGETGKERGVCRMFCS